MGLTREEYQMIESWAKLWGFKITFTAQRRESRLRRSRQKGREKTMNVTEIKRENEFHKEVVIRIK